jgi:hypothetical protein
MTKGIDWKDVGKELTPEERRALAEVLESQEIKSLAVEKAKAKAEADRQQRFQERIDAEIEALPYKTPYTISQVKTKYMRLGWKGA